MSMSLRDALKERLEYFKGRLAEAEKAGYTLPPPISAEEAAAILPRLEPFIEIAVTYAKLLLAGKYVPLDDAKFAKLEKYRDLSDKMRGARDNFSLLIQGNAARFIFQTIEKANKAILNQQMDDDLAQECARIILMWADQFMRREK